MSSAAIPITIRCFASVREALGQDQLPLEVAPGTTVAALRQQLGERYPALQRLPLAYAVNLQYAAADRVLVAGDEVAFIPPISGGNELPADRFEWSREALDSRRLEAECRTDADGAVVTFTGTTRNHNEGAAVVSLAYETYPEMAERVMAGLFAAVRERFEVTRMRVAHRLGSVPVGEASIVVVVTSPHRGPAFAACSYLMDRIKQEVPIWKRELLRDGAGERWIGELPPLPG